MSDKTDISDMISTWKIKFTRRALIYIRSMILRNFDCVFQAYYFMTKLYSSL